MGDGLILVLIDAATREMTLFAAIWFLIGGIDDLAVDLLYIVRLARVRISGWLGRQSSSPALAAPVPPGRIAVFVPAWDESPVIDRMLRTTLRRFEHEDYRIYVGTYPNDLATIEAVARIASEDARVRLVIGGLFGPTTKADCLNTLWRALLRDEAVEGRQVLGVVLHDAEDVVHRQELRVFAQQLARFDAVQLPVLPLRKPGSRFVSGHYLDEFAESHGRTLLVRQSLGAGMPLAGVGCAIRRGLLGRIADARGGGPFDPNSLTEDYEMGLAIAMAGGRTTLARVPEDASGRPVAVRAYFPHTIDAAVRQKTRWVAGIALAGWDRTGWARPADLLDHWMRMRDRRATLAMPVLAIAYVALVLWVVSLGGHLVLGSPGPEVAPAWLVAANVALLGWRFAMRGLFVWQAHGSREALLSAPRMIVGNIIALMAARRAIGLYIGMLRGAPLRWDKTAHSFPDDLERVAA